MKLKKMLAPWKKSYDKPRQHIKNRYHFANRGLSSQNYFRYGCESWTIKKAEHWRIGGFKLWCWRRLLGVSWTIRRSNQVSPKGNQPWIFIGRTGAEAEAPILWPPDVKSWLTGKDPDPRKDWGQEKQVTEDKMIGWHHRLSGHEFEQTLGDSEGQGSLVCCSPWSQK